ncbi:MAG: hypothetical protein V1784_02490 [bacterium]
MLEGLAPAYKPLFELAGPVIRYRILRDLAHRDDSFLETMGLRQEVEKQPFVRAILPQRMADGSWGEWTGFQVRPAPKRRSSLSVNWDLQITKP